MQKSDEMYDIWQPSMSGTVMGVIGIVNRQPTVDVKLRTNEDILTTDEAIETINRLRRAYRKTKEANIEIKRLEKLK